MKGFLPLLPALTDSQRRHLFFLTESTGQREIVCVTLGTHKYTPVSLRDTVWIWKKNGSGNQKDIACALAHKHPVEFLGF